MSNLLENKVCIITGAGKGIGRAITDSFLQNGAKLSVVTRSSADIELLQDEMSEYSNNLITVCGDISEQSVVDEIYSKTSKQYGRADVLVNNAGMRFRKKFTEITADEMQQVMDVNFMSIFRMCQAVIPIFLTQGGGKIINMSSIAGTLGLPELSAYVSSKAAIIGLTRSLALEFAENNIMVNAIAPGFCKTSYFKNFEKNNKLYDFTIERTPMRRWGESEEIANSCLYLASDLCSYTTGETLNVDGGWSAW